MPFPVFSCLSNTRNVCSSLEFPQKDSWCTCINLRRALHVPYVVPQSIIRLGRFQFSGTVAQRNLLAFICPSFFCLPSNFDFEVHDENVKMPFPKITSTSEGRFWMQCQTVSSSPFLSPFPDFPLSNLVLFLRRPKDIFPFSAWKKNIRTITFCLTKDIANGDVYVPAVTVRWPLTRPHVHYVGFLKDLSPLFPKGRRHAFQRPRAPNWPLLSTHGGGAIASNVYVLESHPSVL